MRNPERINPFLEEIAKIWRLNPNLRFGQLLENVYRRHGMSVYYIEDAELLHFIKETYPWNKGDIDDS